MSRLKFETPVYSTKEVVDKVMGSTDLIELQELAALIETEEQLYSKKHNEIMKTCFNAKIFQIKLSYGLL